MRHSCNNSGCSSFESYCFALEIHPVAMFAIFNTTCKFNKIDLKKMDVILNVRNVACVIRK